MIKSIVVIIICLFICLLVFMNLGRFVDVTEEPSQSDIIVSLGGDYSGCRLKTAITFYKNGYSKSKKFIYTGRDHITKTIESSGSRTKYLLNQHMQNKNLIHIDKSILANTMEEVFFIKKYMLTHNYKSVIFVSHPQHSRRISTLAKYIANYEKSGLTLQVVSCNPIWWNKSLSNKISIHVTIREIGKLFYNLIKYGTPLVHYTKYAKKIKNGEWKSALEKLNP